GAAKATTSAPFAGVTEVMVGAPGTVRGVAHVSPDGALVPVALIAATRSAQGVPFTSPSRVRLVVVDPVSVTTTCQVVPSVDDSRRWPVAAGPPSHQGACHCRVTDPSPGAAMSPVGAPGTDTSTSTLTISSCASVSAPEVTV